MESKSCVQVLESLIEGSVGGNIPWVLLRPRDIDAATVFDGDFDFLIDDSRFGEILNTVFFACQAAGISFAVRQLSAFKRQIDLLDNSGQSVTLELWSQAEFRTSGRHGRFTRAAINYQTYCAVDKNARGSLLAAIFVLHLHHKKKDIRLSLVRERFAYFLGDPALAPELYDVLRALESGVSNLDTAHVRTLAYLHTCGIRYDPPWRVLARRMRWAVGDALKWPALRTTAVVGPDGSGKSALIKKVMQGPLRERFRFQRFKRFGRRPLFHVVQSEPRNVRDEKMLWLFLPVAWTYFSISRWFTGWGKPLLLDRYFYDYYVRNVRSYTLPFRRIAAYRLCSLLTPRPERLIIASCPPAVILGRKQEMSEASIDRMYEVYLDQIVRGRIPQTLCCHTGKDLETSVREVTTFLAPQSALEPAATLRSPTFK